MEPPREVGVRNTLSATRSPVAEASTIEYDRFSGLPLIVTMRSRCVPGSAFAGFSGARTMRRMLVAMSSTETTVARCQTSMLLATTSSARATERWGGRRHACRATLGLEHPFDDAARPHAARVDVEVVELVVGVGVDGGLLGFEHDFVFAEDAVHALAQLGGDELAVEAVVAHARPEVVAHSVRLGRDGVHEVTVDALAAVTLGRTRAGHRDAHVNVDGRRRLEVDDLPAVDLAREAGELVAHVLELEGRRVDVQHPALDHDRAVVAGPDEVGLAQLLLADGRGVH